ncbi:MAG: fibrillarin-like rRNA/tRNA 2'-O-methyltransferase [Thermoplasmata archaeon]
MLRIRPSEIPHVFTDGSGLHTLNLVPGQAVYGEKLTTQEGVEYRFWNPRKSKLAALILKGCEVFPFTEQSTVLYLGAASGTTASHVSDICSCGMVYCVEVSPRPFRNLISISESRENMMPLLADANRPEEYQRIVGRADILYQDIAQRNQAEIFLKNIRFVNEDGYAILMLKARSVDVTQRPERVYRAVEDELSRSDVNILQRVNLEPFEKDHAAFITQE